MDITKEQLLALPNITEEDAKKIINELNWITSGSRDAYIQRNQILADFKQWGREFAKEAKEFGFKHRNTNYSSWEYSLFNTNGQQIASLNIYYSGCPSHGNDSNSKVSSDNFYAIVSKSNGYSILHEKTEVKTIEEIKTFLSL